MTRFNCPIGGVPTDVGLMDGWLEHRFELFETFCLPSVLAQENRNFCWLLWMDARTPEKWRARLAADLQPLRSSRVLFAQPGAFEFWKSDIERVVSESSAERIITTRMDNDDALSKDYLAKIAERAATLPRNHGPCVINFRNGCQASHAGIFAVAERLNPFLSVVSHRNPLVSAWQGEHVGMSRFGKVLELGKTSGGAPYWMQTIHGNNVANRLQQKRTRIDDLALERFSLGKNWRELLQNKMFEMAKGEVNQFPFVHRRPWISTASQRLDVCNITISGANGDHLFESIRREKAFDKGDLLQFVSFALHGQPPGLMIDVGASIGNHTVFFAKILGAQVLCVEPNPAALNLLKTNISRNAINGSVTIVESAASDTRGIAGLLTGSLLNMGTARVVETNAPGAASIPTAPLDDILAENSPEAKVSLIKIAVEGFEERVLRGATKTILKNLPLLVIDAASTEALETIDALLRPFHYHRAGPFCEPPAYVFSTSRLQLWRAWVTRRVSRSASRFVVKTKLLRQEP